MDAEASGALLAVRGKHLASGPSAPPKILRVPGLLRTWPALLCLGVMCLAVVLLLPVSAYADDGAEAADLQEQANALIDQEYGRLPQLSALEAKVGQIDPASDQRADALPLLTQITALLDQLTTDARKIIGLYHEAALLNVSPDMKVYLKKREEVWRLHLKEQELKKDRMAKLQTLIGKWESLSDSERTDLTRYVDAIIAQEGPLIALIDEQERASAQYFDDKQLGRRQVDWEGLIGDVIAGFWEPLLFLLLVIAVAVLSLITWVLRRLDRGMTVVGEGLGRLFKVRASGVGFQLRGNPLIWAALVLLVVGVSLIVVGALTMD